MKIATFDLEILREMKPDEAVDYSKLGISCAAIRRSDKTEPDFFYNHSGMVREDANKLVDTLVDLTKQGFTIVTWNGCGFDFQVLAHESGRFDDCSKLVLEHVDLMLIVTFTKGHYLGLDKACRGAGLEGKKHEVALKNGRIITDMGGAQAPALWAAGEHDAVLTYLAEDVNQLLYLTQKVEETKTISWLSGSGKYQSIFIGDLATVRMCFSIREPNTSWMSNPPKRLDFVSWFTPTYLQRCK
jgi:hypothetical protein